MLHCDSNAHLHVTYTPQITDQSALITVYPSSLLENRRPVTIPPVADPEGFLEPP